MKKQFSTKYQDLNDGTKIKSTVKAYRVDLRKDLGKKFIFIDVVYKENGRAGVEESVSIPESALPKLIKLLKNLRVK